jgi:PiT family inorganic phosphate transporter
VSLELILIIAVALLFDFTNGFHDAANAIATSVSTRSISPRLAVAMAGLLNFAGAFISIKVAATIGKGIINPDAIALRTILAGLVGAIAWNLFTWWRGIPTSSSHALIGGVGGAAIVAAGGFDVVNWDGLVEKVIKPSVYVPILGFAGAAVLSLVLAGAVGRYLDRHQRPLKGLQLVSAGFVALTHGTNDATKTMGVIAMALVVADYHSQFTVDGWVKVLAAAAIALGTYVGGWKIVHTLGRRISNLDLRAGLAAQTSAAFFLWRAADFGFPISTTQVITGSVLGAGAKRRFHGTRWSIAGQIGVAWLLTLPGAAAIGGLFALVEKAPGGNVAIYLLVAAGVVGMFALRRALFSTWEEQVAAEETAVDPELLVAPDEKPTKPKKKTRKAYA